MKPYFKVGDTVIGKKHLPVLPRLASTLFLYGASFVMLGVWFADIPQVMKYVPFYRDSLRFPYEDDKRVYILPRKDLKDL